MNLVIVSSRRSCCGRHARGLVWPRTDRISVPPRTASRPRDGQEDSRKGCSAIGHGDSSARARQRRVGEKIGAHDAGAAVLLPRAIRATRGDREGAQRAFRAMGRGARGIRGPLGMRGPACSSKQARRRPVAAVMVAEEAIRCRRCHGPLRACSASAAHWRLDRRATILDNNQSAGRSPRRLSPARVA